ncbi:MAG: flagellar basal-body MS-ring/collar protein FliF [Candidatus Metalachnospira sp.]|nr:flagellar basal-body MS-ring/collar protein FliF [Candidatus Metalachnospira sp.]
MNEKAKELLGKVKSKSASLSPKLKKRIIGTALIVIVFSVGVALFLNNKPYESLFSGLNQEEATEIMGQLQTMGVAYKYSNNGEISVTKDQVEQTKAQLVYEGYPKSGFTYDIFKDNVSMMTTDFEKNSYKIYELQNRIGATIRLFQGVSDAKVTIAMSEDTKYVLDSNSEQKTQASVVVIMKDGGSPTDEQVKGIQRLVSKSIPNMEMTDVVVLDGNGNDVSSTGDSSGEGANKLKLEFEKHMDDSIRAKILTVLSPIYGADNVKVSVRTTVNVDKTVREITNNQLPNEKSDKGIPSKESTDTEIVGGSAATGGVPGAETNADIPTYSQVASGNSDSYYKSQSTIDYLVNQLKEQSQIDAGSIEDMTVSVTINGKSTGDITEDQLKVLVGNAAGIAKNLQGDKIAIVAAPFYENDSILPVSADTEGRNNWIIIGSIASGVLLIILVLIVLLVKRKKKKSAKPVDMELDALKKHSKKSQEAYVKEMMQRKQEEKENQILNLTNERGLELKNKVRTIADENPEISAQLIRSWLKGGE